MHEENDQMYKITILQGNYTRYNVHFDRIDKMQSEYNKFKDNFLKIVENIKSLEKQNRKRRDETLSTFFQNKWFRNPTEDQYQHFHYVTAPNASSTA